MITVIIRHRKENIKKCSLRGLESREDFQFFKYPDIPKLNLSNYITLKVDAEIELSEKDHDKGLLILDATWRYAQKMEDKLTSLYNLEFRKLPANYKTAYPRKQEDCINPESGLASVEAIYVAYKIMGRDVSGLLDNYYWKNKFLEQL